MSSAPRYVNSIVRYDTGRQYQRAGISTTGDAYKKDDPIYTYMAFGDKGSRPVVTNKDGIKYYKSRGYKYVSKGVKQTETDRGDKNTLIRMDEMSSGKDPRVYRTSQIKRVAASHGISPSAVARIIRDMDATGLDDIATAAKTRKPKKPKLSEGAVYNEKDVSKLLNALMYA